MAKNSQARNTNGSVNDKTSQSFKWARMLPFLDYHRWHPVKKLLANKKHNQGKNDNGTSAGTSSGEYVCGPHACVRKEFAEKPSVKEETKNRSLPSSPRTKTSAAAKIKKFIEVTKRRGRHRRSSTCSLSSEFKPNDHPINRQPGHVDQGARASELSKTRGKNTEIYNGEGDENRSCGLCNKMQIECQLGERKEVKELHEDLPLDQLNMFGHHKMPYDKNKKQVSDKNKVERSARFQHSRDFFDAIDVLSPKKQFFLRVSDDPDSSLRHRFLSQQSAPSSTKRKSLNKFGTFPLSYSASMDDKSSSSNVLKCKHGSLKVNNSNNQNLSDKPSTSDDNQTPGRRFKNLRQRLKHAIKESKKESHRIAMDAVFHKLPYGQKNQEESSMKSSLSVGSDQSNFSSPATQKSGKKVFKRSPSLDESVDKYCQLFQTTPSFNRSPYKIETPDRSRLKVKDENASKKATLERNFSLPELQLSLCQKSNDFDGYNSSRMTPNRFFMSFREQRMHESGLELGKKITDRTGENVRNEELGHVNNNEVITIEDTSNKEFETLNTLEDTSCDDNSSMTDTQSKEVINTESTSAIMDESNDQRVFSGSEEPKLQDVESAKEDRESEESSPTFACMKVDEDQLHGLIESLSPILQPLKVSTKDESEFNYVKDILQLSGYSGSQLLGSWYSSEQPVDPSVFVELEGCSLTESTSYLPSKEGNNNSSHLLLFDLINEVLVCIYKRSVSYWPKPLSTCSRTHTLPKGYRVLEEVWSCINWYLACSKAGFDSNLDQIVLRDFSKNDGWMTLQFDAECIGLEVEEFIFDDLLTELIS